MRRPAFAVTALVAALSAPVAAVPPRTPSLTIAVSLSFTPEALARLARIREGVVVDASYYGDPLKRYVARADQVGRIDLGNDRRTVEAQTRRVLLTGAGIDRRRIGWLKGPVYVNVNVYSARRRGPDNILDCGMFDDVLTKARRGIAIRCGLLPPLPKR